MKRILLLLAIIPTLSFGAPFDILISQRNIADTATFLRVAPLPELNAGSVLGIDPYTNLPMMYSMGPTMSVFNGELTARLDWFLMYNKPNFSVVATSGDYNDLINKPSGSDQLNSDWNATSGVQAIINKPSLSVVATSGAYQDLSGVPVIPDSQINSDWSAATGVSEILNKPTTLAGYGITDAYPRTGNPSSFLTGITGSQVISALGFTPYNSSNPSGFVSQSGARSAISLTTTGTSGASTYNSATGVLNIPAYTSNPGTVMSISAGSGLSGGTITSTGTISMPSTGTPGTYSGVSTDAQGRVVSGTTRSYSYPVRVLNTAYQVSSTQDASVVYTVDIAVSSLLLGGSSGRVYLEYADNAAMTTNLVTVNSSPNATSGVLNVSNLGSGNVSGWIPAGKWVRIRTANVAGTPTYTFQVAQEVLQ